MKASITGWFRGSVGDCFSDKTTKFNLQNLFQWCFDSSFRDALSVSCFYVGTFAAKPYQYSQALKTELSPSNCYK
jgi:hypothetical protein